MAERKLMEKAGQILLEKGRAAVGLARERVLRDNVEHAPLREALRYFIEDWNDVLHPALVSLACEAVGGKPEMTVKAGAALVLLAGGADILELLGQPAHAQDVPVAAQLGKDLHDT